MPETRLEKVSLEKVGILRPPFKLANRLLNTFDKSPGVLPQSY
jgi:hypothetical protein